MIAATMVLASCSMADPDQEGESDTGPTLATGRTDGLLQAGPLEGRAEELVAGLVHGSKAQLPATRLGEGLLPPTNRWFSGLVFGDEPQPVFAMPLSFGLTEDGFGLGLPTVVTSEKAIIGPHVPEVNVAVGVESARVIAFDAASVTTELLDADGAAIGRVVIAQGSPFVSYTASVDQSVPAGADFTAVDGETIARVGAHEYGLAAPEGAFDGAAVELSEGDSVTWYALPPDVTSAGRTALAQAALDPLVATDISASLADGESRTVIGYRTAGGSPTLVVTMPHHRDGGSAACDLGSYANVYGSLELCEGGEISTTHAALEPQLELDLSGISEEEKAALVTQLQADVAAMEAFPSDTYFGGKAINRAATLVVLGNQLDAADVVAPLREETVALLREWAQPDGCELRTTRCFQFDEQWHGVVGLDPSFGSEEFNDHHFHYGYFLSAAGMLAADDPELAQELAPVMDLLALDIASVGAGETFPDLRVYDAYQGHSWASGVSPFADGNNQESTSEATNAWNGLALWARASDQPELEARATWLLSEEAAATRAYWTEPPLEDDVYEGFDHQIFALSWGGKRDYATWFSPEPSAMLGIQLIPMGPVNGYLAGDPERITANVAEAAPDGYNVQFGDYLLMYLALADPEAARAGLETLTDEFIDDGDSRTYLMAWIASHG